MNKLKNSVYFPGTRVWTMVLVLAMSLAASATLRAQCTGAGAPNNTDTRCVTAIPIPGNALRAYDISWVDAERGLYFLADRSNSGVDIISTRTNKWIGRAGGFVGVKGGNSTSGPDGVVSHGRWLYAGDGDSTLKVFDISDPTNPVLKNTISTGGKTRVDEMALSDNGKLLLAANNAEDPPYATLFTANGDEDEDSTSIIRGHITVDSAILPPGLGLSIEQPAWDQERKKHRDDDSEEEDDSTGLFYVSIPTIANNPMGCNDDSSKGAITCSGGLLIINPADLNHTTVQPLNECGPNGIAVGPNDNLLEGCTPGNEPSNTKELVINGDTFHFVNVGGITGSDEVWFNGGDTRYYTASSAQIGGAVLGVIDATTNLLVETIPQSSGSHSVAADSKRNSIYVPESAPAVPAVVGPPAIPAKPGDTTNVGAGICGTNNGCIGVFTNSRRHDDD